MDAQSARAHEIETDAHVHVVRQNDRSAYLSLGGRTELVHDRAKVAEFCIEPFRVWFPSGKDDPHLVLTAVRPEKGEYGTTRAPARSSTSSRR
jgi:general stress protein 26